MSRETNDWKEATRGRNIDPAALQVNPVRFHITHAWNGLGEYAAAKLRKGDHIYVEGTLVSSAYEKKIGKGKTATSVQITFWLVKVQSIRKLNRVKGAQAAETLPPDAEASDIPY